MICPDLNLINPVAKPLASSQTTIIIIDIMSILLVGVVGSFLVAEFSIPPESSEDTARLMAVVGSLLSN
jgi:hypothetical protein